MEYRQNETEKNRIPVVNLERCIKEAGDRVGYTLLDERHGCVNGCRCGVSIYREKEYGHGSAHEDQEGFFVLEGRGHALIDGQEIAMEPGDSFIVPAGVLHTMRRDEDCEFCKVFWFHSAV